MKPSAFGTVSAKYATLARREKTMVAIGAVALIGFAGNMLLIEPATAKKKALTSQIESQKTETENMQQVLVSAPPEPNVALRQQIKTLGEQLHATDTEFEAMKVSLVSPAQIGSLLQSLLARQPGLQLLGLKKLPVARLLDRTKSSADQIVILTTAQAASAVAAAAGSGTKTNSTASKADDEASDDWLWRHAVEIRIKGSYTELTAYLRSLEAMPRHVHWGGLDIDASDHPNTVMTVTIYTVSLEKSWWAL